MATTPTSHACLKRSNQNRAKSSDALCTSSIVIRPTTVASSSMSSTKTTTPWRLIATRRISRSMPYRNSRRLPLDQKLSFTSHWTTSRIPSRGVAMPMLDKMVGFVNTSNPEQAKGFYAGKLGFKFLRDDGFALVFDAHGTMLRVGKMKSVTPAQFTVLGWEVRDINASVKELSRAGVLF